MMETAAEDLANGKIDSKTHSSIQKAYANMLHMIDIQIKVKNMPKVPEKLLKP